MNRSSICKPKRGIILKNLFLALMAVILMSVSSATAAAGTVIHVITVKWKADAKPDQIEKVLKVVNDLPAQYPNFIAHVWTKPIKKQIPDGYDHIIVMEFQSEDALKKYVDSPAQKKFYEVYMPLREESKTSDISN